VFFQERSVTVERLRPLMFIVAHSMTQSRSQSGTARRAVGLLDTLLSNKLLISLLRHIPEKAKTWMKRQYWKARISSGSGIVAAEELTRKYREAVLRLLNQGATLGDYLEFGVFNGTSLACMYKVLRDLRIENVRLFGFDSFEGLPETARTESDGLWGPGQFQLDYEYTRSWLSQQAVDWNRVFLVKGWFKDSLTRELIEQHKITKASVIMIDSDLYSSAKEALSFCAPLIRDSAVIFFDDWFPLADRNMGEKKAFDEFMAANPELSMQDFGSYDGTSKVFYIRRGRAG
jgi:O-methyltransferase